MSDDQSFARIAKAIIDANLYVVLGTADETGRPWACPVYYAHEGYREFLWVSDPAATHSRNLAARPELALVIFDSSAPINTGQGVYMAAVARELSPKESGERLATYSGRALAHGGRELTADDIRAPAELRFYGAIAEAQYVLDEGDNRVAVSL
jgi:uncharacterized protein YhbP (UPF0306 family)